MTVRLDTQNHQPHGFTLSSTETSLMKNMAKVNAFVSEKLNDPSFVKRLGWTLVFVGAAAAAGATAIALATKFLPVGLGIAGLLALGLGVHKLITLPSHSTPPIELHDVTNFSS